MRTPIEQWVMASLAVLLLSAGQLAALGMVAVIWRH